jgi:hypothetical protein
MKQFTRREFYNLVWSKPMTKVAEEFGLSDVALHKICKKHRVPKPGLGYWAKVAAGQRVKPIPLFDIRGEVLDSIRIYEGFQNSLPEEAKIVHIKTKARLKKHKKTPLLDATSDAFHPHTQLLKQKLDAGKSDTDKPVRISGSKFFSIATETVSVTRLITVVDVLVREAEKVGFTFLPGEDGLLLVVDDEPVSLCIYEKKGRVPHRLTEKEEKALRKWEADCERERSRNQAVESWFHKPNIPEWDDAYNGQLVIEIDKGSHWDGLNRKFSDGTKLRAENRASTIMGAVADCAVAAKVRRAKEAEREEQARLAAIEWKRQKLEEKRTEALDKKMQLWTKAKEMRNFADEVEAVLSGNSDADNLQTREATPKIS